MGDRRQAPVLVHEETYDENSGKPITTKIVEQSAAILETSSDKIEPLHGSVNTDALENIVGNEATNNSYTAKIQFMYAGLLVTVSTTGHISFFQP